MSDRLPKFMLHGDAGSHPINETCYLCDGSIVAQKKPGEEVIADMYAEATADCTCLPGEGPCRCAELDGGLKDYEQPMPSDVVRKLVDFIKADEPARCDADGCNYQEPHKHGFACDKTCDTCHGHYDDTADDGCTCGATGDACHGLRCVGYGYPDLAESFAQLRRGEVKPARTFKEESWWQRLRIRLRWAKEAFFDDID